MLALVSACGLEETRSSASNFTGVITLDDSCTASPPPGLIPPPNVIELGKNLQIAQAYARIAVNSAAFRECLGAVMSRGMNLGPPWARTPYGPYRACANDPAPATVSRVMQGMLSNNGTRIRCDYSNWYTGRAAYVSNVEEVGTGAESIVAGNILVGLSQGPNCNFNPDGIMPCVDDGKYVHAAGSIAHEAMHQHGWYHVSDLVWGCNNYQVGDYIPTACTGTGPCMNPQCSPSMPCCTIAGNAPGARQLTAGDFCGAGGGTTYGSSVPYEVQVCVATLLGWSMRTNQMHDPACGAGLRLLDSVFPSGDAGPNALPDTTGPSHCVSDPYSAGPAPAPPVAPDGTITFGCDGLVRIPTGALGATAPTYEARAWGSTNVADWTALADGAVYRTDYDYRVCTTTLYGRACTTATFQVAAGCDLHPTPCQTGPDGPYDPASVEDPDCDGFTRSGPLLDNCPTIHNLGQRDGDHDHVGDACDNCVNVPNHSQRNCNREVEDEERSSGEPIPRFGVGDACDPDPCARFQRIAEGPHVDSQCRVVEAPYAVTLRGINGNATGTAGAGDVHELALRRCPCFVGDGTNFATTVECSRRACLHDGNPGLRGANLGWQTADWSVFEPQQGWQTCDSISGRDQYGRCRPNPWQAYWPEVSVNAPGTWELGRVGREAEQDPAHATLYAWDELGELRRGGLDIGSSMSPLRDAGALVQFWSRAAATDTVRSHYTDSYPRPIAVPGLASLDRQGTLCTLRNRLLTRPIPFWEWQPFTGTPAAWLPSNVPSLAGDHRLALLAVPAAVAPMYSELGVSSGSLGIGVFDAQEARWLALGPSTGALPPVRGSAVAFALRNGVPHVLAFGGDTPAGAPVAAMFDGTVALTGSSLSITWAQSGMGVFELTSETDTGPIARSHAVAATSPDANVVYLFGGYNAQGLGSDLWRYDVDTEVWRLLATLPVELADAALAVNDDFVAIFGGRQAKGVLSNAYFLVRRDNGAWTQPTATITARANAALTIHHGRLYVYGGETTEGMTDAVDVLALYSGLSLRAGQAGVASGVGASISVDDAGLLSIVPGHVANATANGGSVTGALDQLQTITQIDWTNRRPTCAGDSVATLGLPCQQPSAEWESIPGVLACGSAGVYCSGETRAARSHWFLPDVAVFAAGSASIATGNGHSVKLYSAWEGPTLVREVELGGWVTALGVGEGYVVAAAGRDVSVLVPGGAPGVLAVEAAVSLCGEVRELAVVGSEIYADTSVGVERVHRVGSVLTRGLVYAEQPFGGSRDVQATTLPASQCRSGPPRTNPVGLAQPHGATLEVTDGGVVWSARGTRVAALAADRTLGYVTLGGQGLVVNAVDDELGVATGAQPEPLRWDAASERVVQLGPHRLSAWLTDRPRRVGRWLVRKSGSMLVFADACAQ